MMKPRSRKAVEHKINRKCRIGRTYEDFEAFRNENPDLSVVEIDSVIGCPGGKTLLTLQFNSCGMMWLFLRPRNTSQSVIDVFKEPEQTLGFDCFRLLFPVILTDNGSEFSNPAALESSSICAQNRTRIFYCDPYSACQKPHVENKHLILRRILEKGTSFDSLREQSLKLFDVICNKIQRFSTIFLFYMLNISIGLPVCWMNWVFVNVIKSRFFNVNISSSSYLFFLKQR